MFLKYGARDSFTITLLIKTGSESNGFYQEVSRGGRTLDTLISLRVLLRVTYANAISSIIF